MILKNAKENFAQTLDNNDKTQTKMLKDFEKVLNTSKKNQLLLDFVESTCSLAWQMALQQPPMLWKTDGVDAKPDENIQEIVPARDMDTKKMEHWKVKYYLEPALVQGGKLFMKGRVFVCF